MTLDIRKDGCSVAVSGCDRLFAWTAYDISVSAKELVGDAGSQCTVNLLGRSGQTDNVVFATCRLAPDPLRRGRRYGLLVVGDAEHAGLFDLKASEGRIVVPLVLHVTLGTKNSTLVYENVPLVVTPRVVQSGGPSPSVSSASMWKVVDGGEVPEDGRIAVGDRTQTSVVAASASGDITVVPTVAGVPVTSNVPFEAYVLFSTSGSWSPLGDVAVGDAQVSWDYRDSADAPSSAWVLHLMTIGGEWHASLKAEGIPPGVEADPDDDLVPGVEVNE